MMPPSPRLSARSTSITYLSDTTIISDQKIADTPPRMFSGVSGMPCCGIEGFLDRVQRAGADVAVDDAERQQAARQSTASLRACVGRPVHASVDMRTVAVMRQLRRLRVLPDRRFFTGFYGGRALSARA